MLIFKIFLAEEWQAFHEAGVTSGAPIDLADGYIHFSTAAQVEETAEKYFADKDGLMLLALESEALGDDLKWEPSRGGQLFPHLYRQMTLADITWARSYRLGPNGLTLPEGVV
ncbi:MAG: DUF952 domain-containing protein [Boseongicola sp.]|nr:DUF952 domain-containing protein [Boseongicola sp.]